jgi:hypothetical protein
VRHVLSRHDSVGIGHNERLPPSSRASPGLPVRTVFGHGLKQRRGIATRYGKTATIHLAGLHIVDVFLWPDR